MTRELYQSTGTEERAGSSRERAQSFLDIREPRVWLQARRAKQAPHRMLKLLVTAGLVAAALGGLYLLVLGN